MALTFPGSIWPLQTSSHQFSLVVSSVIFCLLALFSLWRQERVDHLSAFVPVDATFYGHFRQSSLSNNQYNFSALGVEWAEWVSRQFPDVPQTVREQAGRRAVEIAVWTTPSVTPAMTIWTMALRFREHREAAVLAATIPSALAVGSVVIISSTVEGLTQSQATHSGKLLSLPTQYPSLAYADGQVQGFVSWQKIASVIASPLSASVRPQPGGLLFLFSRVGANWRGILTEAVSTIRIHQSSAARPRPPLLAVKTIALPVDYQLAISGVSVGSFLRSAVLTASPLFSGAAFEAIIAAQQLSLTRVRQDVSRSGVIALYGRDEQAAPGVFFVAPLSLEEGEDFLETIRLVLATAFPETVPRLLPDGSTIAEQVVQVNAWRWQQDLSFSDHHVLALIGHDKTQHLFVATSTAAVVLTPAALLLRQYLSGNTTTALTSAAAGCRMVESNNYFATINQLSRQFSDPFLARLSEGLSVRLWASQNGRVYGCVY